MLGEVEFFNNVSGWGKINGDDGESFFVHHRDITDPRFFPDKDIAKFRTLSRGQLVMFDTKDNGKPMKAAQNVILVDIEDDGDNDEKEEKASE
jgi:cold shock CspA family protein